MASGNSACDTGHMKKADRDREVLRLWLDRPEDKRSAGDILTFCGWLVKHRGELLDYYGDPYRGLKVTLSDHIREPQKITLSKRGVA